MKITQPAHLPGWPATGDPAVKGQEARGPASAKPIASTQQTDASESPATESSLMPPLAEVEAALPGLPPEEKQRLAGWIESDPLINEFLKSRAVPEK